MKKSASFFVLASALAMLTGCEAKEAVQTVDWYKAKNTEREAMIARCKNNPGELMATANCVNAIRAREIVSLGAKRLQLDPLTNEQLRAKGIGQKDSKSGDSK
jgi:hypothetical protein